MERNPGGSKLIHVGLKMINAPPVAFKIRKPATVLWLFLTFNALLRFEE